MIIANQAINLRANGNKDTNNVPHNDQTSYDARTSFKLNILLVFHSVVCIFIWSFIKR